MRDFLTIFDDHYNADCLMNSDVFVQPPLKKLATCIANAKDLSQEVRSQAAAILSEVFPQTKNTMLSELNTQSLVATSYWTSCPKDPMPREMVGVAFAQIKLIESHLYAFISDVASIRKAIRDDINAPPVAPSLIDGLRRGVMDIMQANNCVSAKLELLCISKLGPIYQACGFEADPKAMNLGVLVMTSGLSLTNGPEVRPVFQSGKRPASVFQSNLH